MEEKKVRKKRKLGSYPFISVVFSITVALCVLGLFGWILLHSSRLGNQIQENIEVQVYLNKNISQAWYYKARFLYLYINRVLFLNLYLSKMFIDSEFFLSIYAIRPIASP